MRTRFSCKTVYTVCSQLAVRLRVYRLNSWSFVPLVSFIVNTILTTYVYVYDRRQPAHRAYFLLSLFLSTWLLFEFMLTTYIPEAWVIFILRFEIIFWAPTGILFLRFVYILTGRKPDYLHGVFYFVAGVVIVLGLFTDLIVAGMNRMFWGVRIDGGPFYEWSSDLTIALPFILCFYFLLKHWLKTDDKNIRIQLAYIGVGAMVPFIFGYATIIVLPYWLGIDSIEMLAPGLLFYSVLIFIGIHKRQFLSLSIEDIANDLFRQMQEAVLILDQDKRVTNMNDAARNIFGVIDLDEDEYFVTDLIRNYPVREDFKRFETSLDNRDSQLTLSVSPARIEGQDNQHGRLLIIKDITEEKYAENEIMKMNQHLAEARDEALNASKTKSQFLANMSHELRTPLNAIIGYSEMVMEELGDMGEQALTNDVNKINVSGKHLLNLINDILDLSKVEAGKMELELSEFSLITLLNETTDIISPLVSKNGNQFLLEIETGIDLMYADQLKTRQILFNLLSNACKFTTQGEIRLTVKQRSDFVEFTVSDTGIGMTPEQQSRLFQEFFQGESGSDNKYQGTGLGLVLSRRFSHMMGGDISATSERGEGTSFFVSLPLRCVMPANRH